MARAKLKDLTDWVGGATRDHPRARSNMLVARKAGLFTSTGKGRGSPDMTPTDAAYAVLMALYDGATAHADKGLAELASMPLLGLQIYPNGPREEEEITVSKAFDECNVPLPTHYDRLPRSPLQALTGLFSHDDLPYHFCQCSLNDTAFLSFEIAVMDPDKEIRTELESERDFYEFNATFGKLDIPDDPRASFTARSTTITGAALADLYCLLHGISAADLEARDEAIMAEFEGRAG